MFDSTIGPAPVTAWYSMPPSSANFGEPSERYIPTDMYFACLDGNWNLDGDGLFGEAAVSVANPGDSTDLYAEVFVGRAPASTPVQAAALAGKIIAYENPTVTTYQNRCLYIGEVLFPIDWTPGQLINLDGAAFSEEMTALAGACVDSLRLYENDTAFPGAEHLTDVKAEQEKIFALK